MRLITVPYALVHVSVAVNESTFPIGLVVTPPALVCRSIRPDLDTLAMTNLRALLPLTFVLGHVIHDNERFGYQLRLLAPGVRRLRLGPVFKIGQTVPYFLHDLVFVVESC